MIAYAIEKHDWGKCSWITRHQLLLDPAVPYTSHNSSMCFKADIKIEYLQQIIDYASDFLEQESQVEADPGLCVVVSDEFLDNQSLIDFGYRVKREVVTKDDAYSLARQLKVHLSEHGGSGQGIIGALAGAGLRLSDNDGWIKGKVKINALNNIINVRELCSHPAVDKVKNLHGGYLGDSELILLGNMVKSILMEGKAVVLVHKLDDVDSPSLWATCSKKQLGTYEEMRTLVADQ
ncbi:hypothetical protein [Sporomusa malonica]|uniref:tRNA(Ile2) 2-agmatinylcytidine synthetase n=1 Tax=Sporomusa malonica TaxID=112901 RepID=A0A1W2ECY5_9FIRM|nr:hypothetical protein [Sporomusa malonica]SMD07176.1 tRNA(Ile2) 2-agmatinylcytidine synthetase [Sporomusa malonica]